MKYRKAALIIGGSAAIAYGATTATGAAIHGLSAIFSQSVPEQCLERIVQPTGGVPLARPGSVYTSLHPFAMAHTELERLDSISLYRVDPNACR